MEVGVFNVGCSICLSTCFKHWISVCFKHWINVCFKQNIWTYTARASLWRKKITILKPTFRTSFFRSSSRSLLCNSISFDAHQNSWKKCIFLCVQSTTANACNTRMLNFFFKTAYTSRKQKNANNTRWQKFVLKFIFQPVLGKKVHLIYGPICGQFTGQCAPILRVHLRVGLYTNPSI